MKSKATRSKGSGGTTVRTQLVPTKRISDSLVNYEKWARKNTSGLVYSRSFVLSCTCKRGVSMSIRKHSAKWGGGWSLRLATCNCYLTRRLASHAMSVVHEILDSYCTTYCDVLSPSELQRELQAPTKKRSANLRTVDTRVRRRYNKSWTSGNVVH